MLLKLSRVKLSPVERGQQAGKSSKSLKSAVQFVWVYRRHFAKGLHLQITFFLLTFIMRVKGSEQLSWPVTLPAQGKFRQEVLREGKRKELSEED